MKKDYSYYAFISYNHHDEKKAKWLQSRLEHYRLPAVARKEVGEDVKIRPIFRYVSDLGVALLREKIKQELDASKYLIVICSPHSAKPNVKGDHWVNDEVKRFCDTGRQDCIIPAIVDGVPGDEERECFCPELSKLEIAGVDFQKEKKTVCIQKIVAKLLGLRPDILIERYREEEKKKRRRIFLGFVPFIALLLLGGLFVWDARRAVCNYYANYVDSYGLPKGIFKLTSDNLQRRNIHYRFEYDGIRFGKPFHADSSDWSPIRLFGFHRLLKRVVQAMPNGEPRQWNHTEYGSRPPVQEFVGYDSQGILREVRYWKFAGDGFALRMDKRLLLSDNDNVVNGLLKIMGKDDRTFLFAGAGIASWSSADSSDSYRCEIAQHVFTRTSEGLIKTIRFLDACGAPSADSDGIWGCWFEHDEYGRVRELWYLAPDGRTRESNKRGVAGKRYTYKGRVMETAAYIDASGKPVINDQGWMVCVDCFDADDNNIGSSYLDSKGVRMTLSNGCAGYRAVYEGGNETSITFLDVLGNPVMRNDGFCSIHYTYNNHGSVIAKEFRDINGNPVFCEVDGCAIVKVEYDEETGFRTGWRKFAADGATPMRDEEGYSAVKELRDDEGRLLSLSAIDTNGCKVVAANGYSEVRYAYGDGGVVTNTAFFGTNGCAAVDRNGVSSVYCEYDKFGNEKRKRFFGTDGKPCVNANGEAGYDKVIVNGRLMKLTSVGLDNKPVLTANGFAEREYSYDSRGNEIEKRYFDADGRLVLQSGGYAIISNEYDSVGRNVAQFYLDVERKPVGGASHIACIRDKYDVHGNVLERRYYGVDGNLVCGSDGVAGYSSRFDERGKETNRVYLATDGKTPVANNNGIVQVSRSYDFCGRPVSMKYLDANGVPMLSNEKYAGWLKEYDSRGKLKRAAVHGIDGKPCRAKNGVTGYTCAYDEFGREIARRYFGVDGMPCIVLSDDDAGSAGWDKTFDANGRMLSQKWLDTEGRLVMRGEHGYAGIRHCYDEKGANVSTAYYGTNDMPVVASEGVAGIRYVRDERGNIVDESYFDVEGNPVAKAGEAFVGIRAKFNAHNKKIMTEYYGEDGKRIVIDDDTGLCGWRHIYDQNLREIELQAYGTDGTAATLTGGFVSRKKTYDKNGHLTSEIHYDRDGDVMLWNWRDGYAYSVSAFDASGHETSRRYYGTDCKPCRVEGEEFGWDKKYDTSGRNIQTMWVGSDGRPTLSEDNIAGARFTYSPDGRLASRMWLNRDGQTTKHKDGNAGQRLKFNAQGKSTLVEYIDEEGRLTVLGSGFAGYTNTYDVAGNLIEERWFGINRQPVNNHNGYARSRKEYDSKGRLTREWRYDADDNPIPVDPKSNKGTVLKKYDDKGRVISERYFDVDGEPCRISSGIGGWDADITEDGRRDVRTFVDIDGKPITDVRGCAKIVYEYDEYGHLTLKEYRGIDDGRVAVDDDGEAGYRCRFNALNKEIMREYFGIDGKPILCSGGYSRFEKSYDARGNITCKMFFDEDGNVILANRDEKYAYAVKAFDLNGYEISRRYYGPDRKPCVVSGENYGWNKSYDHQGRLIRIMWVGRNGQPVVDDSNVAGRKFEYKGTELYACTRTWLGVSGKATRHSNGEVVDKRVFDSNGNVTWVGYFEQDGVTPAAIMKTKMVGYRSTYDGRGNEVNRQNFDAAGEPTENRDGWASCTKKYDAKGRPIQTWHFDARGDVVPEDVKMKIWSIEKTYDNKGNVVRKRFYGSDRKPCLSTEGIAGYHATFDSDGREMSRRFFGIDGAPASVNGRFYGVEKTYDKYGNETARIELDANGKVMLKPGADGAAYRTSVFNASGQQIAWINCGTNRLPTVDNDGCACARFSYDKLGRVVREEYLDLNGKLHAGPGTKVAGLKKEYAADGSRMTLWWLGEDGKNTIHQDGNAGYVDHFDSNGRRTQRDFIDLNGRVTALNDGRAHEVWIYGIDGALVAHQILDAKGRLIEKKGSND